MEDDTKSASRFAWIRPLLSHPIVIICYYLAAIALAFAFDKVKNIWSNEAVLFGAIGAFSLIAINLIITVLFFRVGRQKEFSDTVSDLKQFINAQHMGWIVTEQYVRTMEYGSNETWVFTPDLVNDINANGDIFQAIAQNLKDGNRYIYFVKDVPENHQSIHRYRQLHSYRPDQVMFFLVPSYHFLFYTEVAVYNVDNPAELKAVEWLPQDQLNYYIALGPSQTNHVVGIGRMFMAQIQRYA